MRPNKGQRSSTPQNVWGLLEYIGLEDLSTSTGEEIGARCPMHEKRTGARENYPDHFSVNSSSGLFGCFSCHYSGNLHKLVMDVTGEGLWEASQLIRDFNIDLESGGVYEPELSPADVAEHTQRLFDEVERQHRFASFPSPPRRALLRRGISAGAAELYRVKWDPEEGEWIIPINAGSIHSWQRKGSDYVRNYPKGVDMSGILFGASQFPAWTPLAKILVESPLDVLHIHSMGWERQAVSSFGSSVSESQLEYIRCDADDLVLAMDNDAAGIAATTLILKILGRNKSIRVLNYKATKAKDPGEMDAAEFKQAIDTAIPSGLWFGGSSLFDKLGRRTS